MPSSSRKNAGEITHSESKPAAYKFIPNLTQLQEAVKTLPDPELWSEDVCRSPILVDKKQQFIEFTRKRIARGKISPYRWIYEGKVLIRKRDG